MEFRCVKCNDKHEPGNCNIAKDAVIDKNKIFCVNCKKFDHPASFRGCEVLQEIFKKAQENRKALREKRETRNTSINNFVKKTISFADMTKRNITLENDNNTDKGEEMNGLLTFEKKILNLLENIKKEIFTSIEKLAKQTNDHEIKMNYCLRMIEDFTEKNGQ